MGAYDDPNAPYNQTPTEYEDVDCQVQLYLYNRHYDVTRIVGDEEELDTAFEAGCTPVRLFQMLKQYIENDINERKERIKTMSRSEAKLEMAMISKLSNALASCEGWHMDDIDVTPNN